MLQFLVIAKSDETTSNLLKKSMNRFDKAESFDDMTSVSSSISLISSSISSSFEGFSNWLLVWTILVENDDRIWKLRIMLRFNTEVKMAMAEMMGSYRNNK